LYRRNDVTFYFVTYYPGENEYGLVFQVSDKIPAGRAVAEIRDGDFANCRARTRHIESR
jgi:hypothetical protein